MDAPNRRGDGFTLVELLAVICVVIIGLVVLWPTSSVNRHRCRGLKDSTQVRGIHQSMVTWAQSNQDRYPIPSLLDKDDQTIAPDTSDDPSSKDLTRHVLSILVFNGFISTELLISPAESNTAGVVRDDAYRFDAPAGAADLKNALWDPAFRAAPADDAIGPGQKDSDPGSNSYAFSPIAGKRTARWASTFNSTEAALGNRGPLYDFVGDSWRLLKASPFGDASNTLLIHGTRTKWEGNIAYNDNHVQFETKPDPDDLTFTFTGVTDPKKQVRSDNLFANEEDDTRAMLGAMAPPDSRGRQLDTRIGANSNAYLKIITNMARDGSRATVWQD
jgi:type II secretory pathway pseudopilin PulG